jgi:hypothetical protein
MRWPSWSIGDGFVRFLFKREQEGGGGGEEEEEEEEEVQCLS